MTMNALGNDTLVRRVQIGYVTSWDLFYHTGCEEVDDRHGRSLRTFREPSFVGNRCRHIIRLQRLPSTHILMGEWYNRQWGTGVGNMRRGRWAYRPYVLGNMTFRHVGNRANTAFLDGSVRSLTWDEADPLFRQNIDSQSCVRGESCDPGCHCRGAGQELLTHP